MIQALYCLTFNSYGEFTPLLGKKTSWPFLHSAMMNFCIKFLAAAVSLVQVGALEKNWNAMEKTTVGTTLMKEIVGGKRLCATGSMRASRVCS